MQMPEITLALFYAFNALRVVAYLPQIWRVAVDNDGAKAISYTTWCVWIGANGSTAAYALIITPSMALFVVSALNALGCAAVVVLTAWKRRHFAIGNKMNADRVACDCRRAIRRLLGRHRSIRRCLDARPSEGHRPVNASCRRAAWINEA